jgi:hypothetical protein
MTISHRVPYRDLVSRPPESGVLGLIHHSHTATAEFLVRWGSVRRRARYKL